ncbi:Alpha-1,6-mannosyl-glycoprotein 2-beta-N-acetylglucosaminyltransferase [Melia azedarach]|uniref:Alpha-1,6-mannosyl-glycoprotein 2-beta-N-acetylglucosaminyltransferase n=1 Tax=Melia azedarach TaxID=155640 RepID=A0ACC1WRR6_MELAZ|nr:Alpha-1,6-mannosyl-glycoprotein 2-beta-N-acetylglucosaminyltransferase [Melia azedarach]
MDNTENPQGTVVPPVEGVAGGGTAYGWNDGGSSCSLKGSIDLTEVPAADLVHVWCMPSTANVGPQEMPRHLEPINLLAARNERESVQIALRPKVSWSSSGNAGVLQVQCSDLCSTTGDRLIVGQSLTLRRVVPILGVPDALVPIDLPTSQIGLLPGETTALWVSIDVPSAQPPGLYEGEIVITSKADTESLSQCLGKGEKHQLFMELRNCLDIVEPIDGKLLDEVVERAKCATTTLRRVLFSPLFSEFFSDNGPIDMMDEDAISNLSVRVKLSLTVWDFILPATPSLPAVFGISDTVIEDRFGVQHGSDDWYEALDQHFKWLLQYRISPYFCRWGESMRVLTYTSPWPADHPKSDEYFSDPRLAAYAVPYRQPVSSNNDGAKDYLQKEVEILRTKAHWKKAYFYLWDEPLNMDHYNSVRNMASEIHAYAPDARVLTTYYCGPSDAPLAPTPFESFVKVPKFLRPHTQIYCTSEWVLGNREDLVKDILTELQPENGEEWWTYVCMGPSDPHPNWHLGMRGTQHRAVMWRVWKEGGTGFLYWGANCYEKATAPSAEIRFRRGLPPGDGVLFYPGEVFSSSRQPVASLRLERILSGLQDIEYLNLYASRFNRDEGLALLEKTGIYLGPERYTFEHMPIDVMRGEIFNTCRP